MSSSRLGLAIGAMAALEMSRHSLNDEIVIEEYQPELEPVRRIPTNKELAKGERTLSDQDRQRLAAAQAKRDRKAAKRLTNGEADQS